MNPSWKRARSMLAAALSCSVLLAVTVPAAAAGATEVGASDFSETAGNWATGLGITQAFVCGHYGEGAKSLIEWGLSKAFDGIDPYVAFVNIANDFGHTLVNYPYDELRALGFQSFVNDLTFYRDRFLQTAPQGQQDLVEEWARELDGLPNTSPLPLTGEAKNWGATAQAAFGQLQADLGLWSTLPQYQQWPYVYQAESGGRIKQINIQQDLTKFTSAAQADPVASADLQTALNRTPTPLNDWWSNFADWEMQLPGFKLQGPLVGSNVSSHTGVDVGYLAAYLQAEDDIKTQNLTDHSASDFATNAIAGIGPDANNPDFWKRGLLLELMAYQSHLRDQQNPQYNPADEDMSDFLANTSQEVTGLLPYGAVANFIEKLREGCKSNPNPVTDVAVPPIATNPSAYGAYEANSADPNYIAADPPGVGAAGWVAPGAVAYFVHFENLAVATATVQNVRVVLRVDPNLDLATVRPGGSSFAGTEFALDPATRTITWNLPGIKLPPDTAPPNGEGWVSFTVVPNSGLSQGTRISESAQVFFDYNPPVSTATAVRTIDAVPPTVAVKALAASEAPGPVTVSWTGQSQAGISTYTVYMSEDGGPLVPLDTTPTTSDAIQAAAGHSYGIAVRATDIAGLSSPVPTSPQVRFQVPSAAPAHPSLYVAPSFGPTKGIEVGPAGGTLISPDGLFQLAVPPSGLVGGAALWLGESGTAGSAAGVPVPSAPGAAGLPPGLRAVSPFFTLSGAQLQAAAPAIVHYAAPALAGLSPQRLSLYLLGGQGGWRALPTAVDPGAGTVTGSVRGPGTLVAAAATVQFSDLPATHWAVPYVDQLLAAGAISGYPDGTFRPDQPVTRAEFVKLLDAVVGLTPEAGKTLAFADVPPSAWFAPYVAAAVRAGIVQGTSAATFSPQAPVTREQAAALLARALGLAPASGQARTFTDGGRIDPWAAPAVAQAVAAGLLAGFPDGSFQPLGPLTRAQAAKVLAIAWQRAAP